MSETTFNKYKDFYNELATFIIEEIESYNLDFGFSDPNINFYKYRVAIIDLWGQSLPEDVNIYDEEVLTKFLIATVKNFMALNPIEELKLDVERTYCKLYPDDKEDKIAFYIYIIINE